MLELEVSRETLLEENRRLRAALTAMTGQTDLSAWLSDDPAPSEDFEPVKTHGGHKMPVESPLEHQKYFASDECQAKLKSGDYVIPSKSADISHRR